MMVRIEVEGVIHDVKVEEGITIDKILDKIGVLPSTVLVTHEDKIVPHSIQNELSHQATFIFLDRFTHSTKMVQKILDKIDVELDKIVPHSTKINSDVELGTIIVSSGG